MFQSSNFKNKRLFEIAVIIVVAVLVIGGLLYLREVKNQYELKVTAHDAKEKADEWRAKKQTDEFTDWKTYSNETYGYEIKYPSSYKVGQYYGTSYMAITNLKDEQVFMAISALRDRRGLTFEQFIHNDPHYGAVETKEFYFNEETISINGIKVYGFTIKHRWTADRNYFFLKNPNQGINVSWPIDPENINGESGSYMAEFNQILSTLKFIK